MSMVELRYGDVFDDPSELVVLPCSTFGTVTELVREKLFLYNISYPKSGMRLGDLDVRPLNAGGRIAQYVAFAASVATPNTSSFHAIRQIGMLLGKETRRNRAIRRIAAPLLGAGAGGLQHALVAGSLGDGFRSEAHEDSTLTISVLERGIFELICSRYSDLAASVSSPGSLATVERSGNRAALPALWHVPIERAGRMTTAAAAHPRGEPAAPWHVVKPPGPGPDRTFGPQPPASQSTRHTILFLAANPLGTDRLVLDQEARAIQEELERSGLRRAVAWEPDARFADANAMLADLRSAPELHAFLTPA